MSSLPVVHLARQLLCEPIVESVPGVTVRNFAGEQDVAAWLDLRERAFSTSIQSPPVRPWTRADFEAEFLKKAWWSPDRMWFAAADQTIVGSVTLALRGRKPAEVPVIHWLMVSPQWRRQGIGRRLMTTLEAACWQTGYRRISLETHAQWTAADAFYRATGYGRGEQ